MSWLDSAQTLETGGTVVSDNSSSLLVRLPGASEFVPVNECCVKQDYADDLGGPLLIIVDECGELLLKSGLKDEESKQEDALRDEIQMIITSLCQLSRSAAIALMLATQRPDSKLISGNIKNNPLDLNTSVVVKK